VLGARCSSFGIARRRRRRRKRLRSESVGRNLPATPFFLAPLLFILWLVPRVLLGRSSSFDAGGWRVRPRAVLRGSLAGRLSDVGRVLAKRVDRYARSYSVHAGLGVGQPRGGSRGRHWFSASNVDKYSLPPSLCGCACTVFYFRMRWDLLQVAGAGQAWSSRRRAVRVACGDLFTLILTSRAEVRVRAVVSRCTNHERVTVYVLVITQGGVQ